MMRLKDSMLLSIPLYASEIWGLNKSEEIEKLQNNFVRRLLHLPFNSPGYLLRMETGMLPTSYHILRRSLCWLNKVREQDDNRLTSICLQELMNLDKTQNDPSPYNWFTRLKQEIQKLEIPYVMNVMQEYNWDYLNTGNIVSVHIQKSEQADIERCDNSSYSSFYHRMKSKHSPELYLSYKMGLPQKRTFCNMRLHADRLPFLNVYINHISYKFKPTEKCPLCGKDNDDLFDALASCIHYNCIRPSPFTGIRSRLLTHKLFRSYDTDSVKILCSFVNTLLRRRQFLMGD